ncbi:rRNA processing protein-related [Heracleum sosnowskyi]|uniref:rRNA processing protein-related n=1 Tax=Heracleum sosnowskyi TaxID=360622 RepID=A0AAD8GYD7_9APIA|nr:rRNA processing protein-related [Heracleum sosnowskyi]
MKRGRENDNEDDVFSEEGAELLDSDDNEVDGSDFGDYSDALENHDSDGVEDDENDGLEDDSNGDDDDEISGEEEEGEDDEEMEDAEKEERDMAEVEELEKEYTGLRHQEQDLLRNLRRQKDEDVLKGQAVKNQKALWDKTLELRFLLQKAFSNSNRLPQDPIRSSFCDFSSDTSEAYSDLVTSSKKTLDSILKLQEALLEKNPTITQGTDGSSGKKTKQSKASENSTPEEDHEWLKISEMQSRTVSFRNKAVDKWQRKAQVTTGAAAIKGRLQAFNQSISDQVSAYMRDPSRMVNGMQQRRSAVSVFGMDSETSNNTKAEEVNGDPELLDDSEFYQQLLKEFFETIDPTSSEAAFYALKRMQTKKRKVVDQRASKSRKIRYHVHEKIVNFMAPRPMNLPPMAPKLFENLFGFKAQKAA